MKIYLAARYSRCEEMCGYAKQLEEMGHTITSRWIYGGHKLSDLEMREQAAHEKRVQFAEEDYNDLYNADLVISFTEEPRSTNSRGGRHVEFGIALGLNKVNVVIGPRENVFHCLLMVSWFPDWDSYLVWIKDPYKDI